MIKFSMIRNICDQILSNDYNTESDYDDLENEISMHLFDENIHDVRQAIYNYNLENEFNTNDLIILNKNKNFYYHYPILLENKEKQMITIVETLNNNKFKLCCDLKNNLFVLTTEYFTKHYKTEYNA